MPPLHAVLRLSRFMTNEDEIVLVPPFVALNLRVEGGYQWLDSRQAVRLFDELDRLGKTDVRRFVAEARLSSIPLSRLDDHEVFALVRQGIRDGHLLAAQKSAKPAPGTGTNDTAEQRRLVRAIEKSARGRIEHRGRRYHLLADVDVACFSGRDDCVVLPRTTAEQVLAEMASEPGTPSDLAPLLTQARSKLAKDWRAPSAPNGLVVLRREVRAQAIKVSEEPAITPSRMRALVEEEAAITTLDVPPFIASGHEMITMRYAFRDHRQEIAGATLQIFSKLDGSTPVWSRQVPSKHLTELRGSLDWNGKLDGSHGDAFPDGFATLEGSPYRVRLSAQAKSKELSSEAPIRVEVAQVKLEVAAASLKNPRHQEVAKRIGPLVSDQAIPLPVVSFLSERASDLSAGKDAGHQQAKKPWKDFGIPIITTVLVKSSRGQSVVAGKSLGRAVVLWDYVEPPPLSSPAISGQNQAYLDAIAKQTATRAPGAAPPGGHNTPAILGGKRAPATGFVPVLAGPNNAIQDFPFVSKAGSSRFWAVFAEIHRQGEHEGRTGIIFSPSVVAGDCYKISAYIDWSGTLDSEAPIPTATPHADSGRFEIRRTLSFVRFVRKCREVAVKLHDINQFTAPAFLDCRDLCPDKDEILGKAAYTSLLQDALAKIKPTTDVLFDDTAMLPIEDQYDQEPSWWDRLWGNSARVPTGELVRFRQFADFISTCEDAVELPTDPVVWNEIREWKANGRGEYGRRVQDRALALASRMLPPLATRPGVTVAGFSSLHNIQISHHTNGLSIGQEVDNRKRTAILLCADRADTLAHELGHCLFLPHAPSKDPRTISGVVPSRHLPKVKTCLMAYGENRPGFCAICLLRLRGANGENLGPKGLVP